MREILDLVAERGPMSTQEIASEIGLGGAGVRVGLRRLRQLGLVEPTDQALRSRSVRYRASTPGSGS